MVKPIGRAKQLRPPNRPRVPHHTCVAEVRSQAGHPYGYCKICGRVMAHVKVKELTKQMEQLKALSLSRNTG